MGRSLTNSRIFREMDLAAKVAIITGSGGRGSGRAWARRLGDEGCHVVVSDLDEARERETARLAAASQKEREGLQSATIMNHSTPTATARPDFLKFLAASP